MTSSFSVDFGSSHFHFAGGDAVVACFAGEEVHLSFDTPLMRPDGANWYNQLARDGSPAAPVTPARVLYHLFLCVAEAERVLVGQSPARAFS